MDRSRVWNWLEKSFPAITALAALVAALGGIWAAIASYMSATAAFGQLDLQRKPVIVLTCNSTFRLEEEAHKVSPPTNVLFLEPGQSGLVIKLDQTIPTYTSSGEIIEYPPIYARCSVTNAGALPVVQVELPLTVSFYQNVTRSMTPEESDRRTILVPFLKPGEAYEFGIAQGSVTPASFRFDRTGSLTRIDTEQPAKMTVFDTPGYFTPENQIMPGFARRTGPIRKH
jgi:hypothetical protein